MIKNLTKKYETGESRDDELELEEPETNELDQIENPVSLKSIDIKQNRENDDLVDTDIDLEKNVVRTLN